MDLHIYGQQTPHDTIYIIGTRTALATLAHDLFRAVYQPSPEIVTHGFFTEDGEGFSLHIRAEKSLADFVVPYTDEAYAAPMSNVWPWKADKKP